MTSAWCLALVWVYFSSTAAQDTMKYIYVSKLKLQGITWHNYSSNEKVTGGYQQINYKNEEFGEISFFRGYSQPTPNSLCPSNLRLHIMTGITPMPDNKDKHRRFWILKRGTVYTGFNVSDTVYVSGTKCSGLTELYYASCAKRWVPHEHETMYSRISTWPNICGEDYKHHEEKFYAYVGIRCLRRNDPPHGRLSSSVTRYGTRVTYICNEGYQLHPPGATIECQEIGLWSPSYMKCQAVRCPERNDPPNGQLSSMDNSYRSRVTYRCNDGYRLQPPGSAITCQANRQWSSNDMNCQVVTCPSGSDPPNGRLSTLDNSYGSTVTYRCNKGYKLHPRGATITCQANGHWSSNDMKCQVVDCGNPGVSNEVSVTADKGTTYNQTVQFSCRHGFRLQGSVTAICNENGGWQFSQNDKPSCLGITCPQPKKPDNGRAIGNSPIVVGSQWTYSCELGYSLVGGETITCLQDGLSGRWSTDAPTCRFMMCLTPRVPENGVVRGGQYTYGSVIHYSCNAGYRLQGADHSTCRMAGWDGQVPTCLAITCPDPGDSPHARREGTSLAAGATMTYTCQHGYTMDGAASITCGDAGRWSNRRPHCEPISCPRIRTPRYSTRDGDAVNFGSTFSFLCQPGYQMQGDANTTCKADGTWSNPTPTCVACPLGHYKERREERTCIKCPKHSTTITTATANRQHCTCTEGAVGPQGGPCAVVKCDALNAPENGRLSDSCGTGLDSQCDVTCDPGYVLTSGSRRRQCTSSGWTGSNPKCTACAANKYKVHPGALSCTPCPVNTVTTPGQPASAIEACKCATGFTRSQGTTCLDVDECKVNNGGCNQTCVNTQGSFVCRCHIPGYELMTDGKGCVMTQTCSTLIQKPSNGQLQCSYIERTNGHICFIGCDQGYFFVSGANNYLTCGPPTDFEWSHRLVNKTARLPSCTREFFVDFELPLRLNYSSTGGCSASPMDPGDLKTRLEATTNSIPICHNKCAVDDLNITCREGNREMVVDFDVLLQNPHPHEVPFNCTQDCKHRNMRSMLGNTFQLKRKFQARVKAQPQSFQLTSQGAPTVIPSSFWFGQPRMLCDEGRVLTKNRLCVPCDKGFHLPERDMECCLPCPKGTYQNEYGQTRCKSCLDGSTTVSTGADHPTMCSERVVI